MGADSKIEWTHHTFNPWWGCERVSPGCQHCYAEALAKRYGHDVWGKSTARRFFGEKHWSGPVRWNRGAEAAGERRRVFCASMADVFEDREDLLMPRQRLFELIEDTPSLDWLLLTKRPHNVEYFAPMTWERYPPNVWIGTTVEDQLRADERVWQLRDIPAAVRFLSCEPLLGPVDLTPWVREGIVDWVIVGGESGHRARPMDPEWARSLRDQCIEAGVPFFFKQWGGRTPKAAGRELDGRTWDEFPSYAQATA